MEIKVLSSKKYDNTSKNYGDCFIINNGKDVVIYDCGSEEHAERAIEYLDNEGIKKVKVILSHNDSDHFDGIKYLIDNNRVSKVHTVLLLKYKTELLKIIDDKRKNRNSIEKQILDIYSNIAELGNLDLLMHIEENLKIIDGVTIVGPYKDYMLNAFAKHLDTREGDTIDSETIVNATSVQVAIDMDEKKLLLCGDCSYSAIDEKVQDYEYIQLPHHGKQKQAEKIFEAKKGENGTLYIVSDNTGSTNGGSDNLPKKGYNIKNTKNGDIELGSTSQTRTVVRSYSSKIINEIFN